MRDQTESLSRCLSVCSIFSKIPWSCSQRGMRRLQIPIRKGLVPITVSDSHHFISGPIIKWTIKLGTLSSHFENMSGHDQVIFELIAYGFSQFCEGPWANRLVFGQQRCSSNRSKPSHLDSILVNRAGIRRVADDLSQILRTVSRFWLCAQDGHPLSKRSYAQHYESGA
jgi:hypothetical protein